MSLKTRQYLFQIVTEVLRIPHVVWCGEVFGVIEVAVNEEIKTDSRHIKTVEMIERVMDNFMWTDFIIKYFSKDIKDLTSIGTKVRVGVHSGTLGAFTKVLTYTPETKIPFEQSDLKSESRFCRKSLVAIISGHLAHGGTMLYIEDKHIADILDPLKVQGADIAAAKIFDQYRDSCKQVFKTQGGIEVPCRLLSKLDDLIKSMGETVHIWGATSQPGLGKIVSCSSGIGSGDKKGHIITITDRSSKEFAHPGDSGSVVCLTSKTGKELIAVGIVMGELFNSEKGKRRQYIAMEILYGIKILEQAHQMKIQWPQTTGELHDQDRPSLPDD